MGLLAWAAGGKQPRGDMLLKPHPDGSQLGPVSPQPQPLDISYPGVWHGWSPSIHPQLQLGLLYAVSAQTEPFISRKASTQLEFELCLSCLPGSNFCLKYISTAQGFPHQSLSSMRAVPSLLLLQDIPPLCCKGEDKAAIIP